MRQHRNCGSAERLLCTSIHRLFDQIEDWDRRCPNPNRNLGWPRTSRRIMRMVARAGVAAKFTFLVHSHMLRHGLRLQARQRRPRHSRHPSLFRPPIDHVHGPLHGHDAEPVQKLLEGLTFQASRIKDSVRPVSAHARRRWSPKGCRFNRRLLVSDCHIPECICRMARPIVFWA
jgi:hypothetical protein